MHSLRQSSLLSAYVLLDAVEVHAIAALNELDTARLKAERIELSLRARKWLDDKLRIIQRGRKVSANRLGRLTAARL
jgi:hypothetical protein